MTVSSPNSGDSNSKRSVIVLLSGGLDSASCVNFFLTAGYQVQGLFIDYGQPARLPEYRAVDAVSQHFGIKTEKIGVSAGAVFSTGELPGRNAFLISTSVFFAGKHRGLIALGLHAGTGYYDCSPTFLERMNADVTDATGGHISIAAPFLNWRKEEVLTYALESEIPIKATYSCEKGSDIPCGTCASCKDRNRFFVSK